MMFRRTRRVVAGVGVAGLLLVACASDDDSSSVDDGATTTRLTLIPTTTTTTVAATTTTTSTTTTSTTTTSTTSTTTTLVQPTTTEADPAITELILTTVGIGSAEFGADPDGVIGYISAFLGDPTDDTNWVDPFTIGPCSGNEIRLVSWGVLTLTFGDVSNVVQGRRHFYAYTYGDESQIGLAPIGLETDRGLTVGSRVIDLVTLYPGVTLNPEDDFISSNFYVNDNLRGFLTGLADDDTATVILGGIGCFE